jgi:hypothetical protein
MYLMGVVDGADHSDAEQLIWKIGRSNDSLARAGTADSDARKHKKNWRHHVYAICRGHGSMERLLHDEFAPHIPGFGEHFYGDEDMPARFLEAVQRLLPKQMELQAQRKRKAEEALQTEGERAWDIGIKRRRVEIQVRQEELALAKTEAAMILEKAQAEAAATLAKAKADAEVRMLASVAAANELIIAKEVKRRNDLGEYWTPRELHLLKPSDFA